MAVKFTKPEINVREKLAELDKPSGIAGEAMLRADTVAEQQALIGVGNRNILVNGSFQISQRGDYSSASATSTNNYVFKLDRWNNHTTGSITSTVQHLSGFPTTNEKYVRTVATNTGTGYMRTFQRVEGNFEGRELTFSAWVRSNRPTRLLTICTGAWLSNDTSARHSGNGQWEKLTLTATAGNFNNPHFVISNNAVDHGTLPVVAGDYFDVANCQLEEGKIATPFEYRTYGQELQMCQRFFQIIEAAACHASSTTAVEFSYQFNTEMNHTPTVGTTAALIVERHNITIYTQSSGAASLTQATPLAAKFTLGNFSGLTAGNAYSYEGNHSSSGHITLEAEL
jgi:hypothetical protein